MKRRGFLIVIVAFVGLLIAAWFSRPSILREQMERQGIHLTEIADPIKSQSTHAYFSVPRDEVPKLEAWLAKVGFQNQGSISYGDSYIREQRLLFFFNPGSQIVIIGQSNDGSYRIDIQEHVKSWVVTKG